MREEPLRPDLELICGRVTSVSDRDDVAEFAIGTTVDLAHARGILRAEDIVPVYEAESPEDAAEVEETLLARFASHIKCANEEAYEPDTSTLDDDSVLSVFVAIWWESQEG